jgi:hypothetical protein
MGFTEVDATALERERHPTAHGLTVPETLLAIADEVME